MSALLPGINETMLLSTMKRRILTEESCTAIAVILQYHHFSFKRTYKCAIPLGHYRDIIYFLAKYYFQRLTVWILFNNFIIINTQIVIQEIC